MFFAKDAMVMMMTVYRLSKVIHVIFLRDTYEKRLLLYNNKFQSFFILQIFRSVTWCSSPGFNIIRNGIYVDGTDSITHCG